MSQPLTPAQKDTITQVLNFLDQLIRCYEPHADKTRDQVDELKAIVADLQAMLADGRIRLESQRTSVKAETTRNGIFLNDTSTYALPGDLMLGDCPNGYFESLWTIIEVLLHERYHYHHTTGVWGGGIRRVFDVFFGGFALILESALGEKQRTWLWHEKICYSHAFRTLTFLRHMLYIIALLELDCIPCLDKHALYAGEAAQRQDPHSTFGN